jgi:anti-sigma B factor antagonist
MQLHIDDRDGLKVVRVEGELDTFGTRAFRDELERFGSGDRLVVDLASLSFIDSAGLHALFGVGRTANDVGAAVVFVVPPESAVRRVIEIVQLADVSPVCDSVEDAVSRLD